MFKTYEQAEAVKRLQKYLSNISNSYIAPSGVYDERTKDAVILIQKEHSLIPSGKVDKQTNDLIYSEYEKKKTLDNAPRKINFPIDLGNYGDEIQTINEMMITVMNSLGTHHSLRATPLYTEQSEKAQKQLMSVFNLDGNIFDEIFYDSLRKEYVFLTTQKDNE